MKSKDLKKKKVGIFYHYVASYRYPIFSELMNDSDIEYSLFSGTESEFQIKKLDSNVSKLEVKQGGLRWFFFENVWFLKKLLWQKGLINFVFKSDLDIYVFLGSPSHISTWISSIVARLRGKKVYFWMHGLYSEKLSLGDYFKMYVFYKIPNGFLLYGNRAANILKKHKIKDDNNISVIYNSLNYRESLLLRKTAEREEVENFRSINFNDAETPVVTFVGRVTPAKQLHLLFEAQKLSKSKNTAPKFNIIIIGNGDLLDDLKTKVESWGLTNHVKFMGAIYEESKIAEVLTYSDLCINPGEVGLAAMHSMSYGTPVISHNNLNIQMPEVEAIIPEVTGNLYEWNNMEDLESKIDQWVSIYPVKTSQIVSNCYAVIDDFYNPIKQCKILKSLFI